MDATGRDIIRPHKIKEGFMSHSVFRQSALRLAVAMSLGAFASASLAQEQDAAPDDDVDEVVVTGTRVAARTRLDSVAPVDVLSAETLTREASTELAEALS